MLCTIKTWELRVTLIVWAVITAEVLGWLDPVVAELDSIGLTEGKTRITIWSVLKAIATVTANQGPAGILPTADAPGEIFGENVFTKTVMQKRLPKLVYKSLLATMEHAQPLDPVVADIVASAMMDWAQHAARLRARVDKPLRYRSMWRTRRKWKRPRK